jgi:hypothetical protein
VPHVRRSVPGFPVTQHQTRPPVRLSLRKAAWSSTTPPTLTGNPGYVGRKRRGAAPSAVVARSSQYRWRGWAGTAYPEVVVSLPFYTLHRITLPTLLLALLMTQAASSVCTAQCVQHQPPVDSTGVGSAVTHCHSMLMARSEANGATIQTAAPCTHSVCAIDLLANTRERTPVQPRPLAVNAGPHSPHFGLNIASFTPAYSSPRSSISPSPLITALRI